ncbi:helix-turn-helix transcriptional regulator [Tamlana crocina]
MGEQINHFKFSASNEAALASQISKLVQSCNGLDHLNIAIYSLEKGVFVFGTPTLEKIMGTDVSYIFNNNWNYWFSLIKKDERNTIKNRIKSFLSAPFFDPAFSLKYHLINKTGTSVFLKHDIVLHRMGDDTWMVNYFFDLSAKEQFEACLKQLEHNNDAEKRGSAGLISPREKEVLKLVADGFSSKQIADRLFISSHTAITHRKNLIEKFNVKNTAQLIKRAYQNVELW